MLDMGGYGPGAYFILNAAVDNETTSRWPSGRSSTAPAPTSTTSSHPKFKPARTVYDDGASCRDSTEMADLLAASRRDAGWRAAIDRSRRSSRPRMRLDRAGGTGADRRAPRVPRNRTTRCSWRRSATGPTSIALLLDLGVPLEIADAHNTRALHHAAGDNALRAAAFLIERGAEIDPRETHYGGAPIGWAAHGDDRTMLDLLSRYSRNVWTLTFRGYVDRVRELLREDPALAQADRTRTATRRSGGCQTMTPRRWRWWSCCSRPAPIRR